MQLISAPEAAGALGVSLRQFRRDVQSGLVSKYFQEGKSRPVYDLEEVRELSRLKKNTLSFRKVSMESFRTNLSVKRMEKIVKQLMDVLGLDLELLDLSEQGVEQLHYKAQEDMHNPRALKPHEVQKWSHIYFAIGPEYFDAVEKYLHDEEPYRIYLELAGKIFKDMPVNAIRNNSELMLIYGGMKSARNALKQSAFFYVYKRWGKRPAFKAFPDLDDFHEQMLALSPP